MFPIVTVLTFGVGFNWGVAVFESHELCARAMNEIRENVFGDRSDVLFGCTPMLDGAGNPIALMQRPPERP